MKKRPLKRRSSTQQKPFDYSEQQQLEEGMARIATMQAGYYKGLVAGGMPEDLAAQSAESMIQAILQMIGTNPNFVANLTKNK